MLSNMEVNSIGWITYIVHHYKKGSTNAEREPGPAGHASLIKDAGRHGGIFSFPELNDHKGNQKYEGNDE